jgi:hypothetical protein
MRDAIPFSDVERKMLLFSEVGWAPPDTMEVAAEFDRQFDQAEYEKKVATITKHLDKRLRKDSPAEHDDWKLAVEYLKRKDHYINVMIARASLRPPWDQLKLFATALLLAAGLVCYGFIAAKYKLTLLGRDRRGPGPKSYDDSRQRVPVDLAHRNRGGDFLLSTRINFRNSKGRGFDRTSLEDLFQ